VPGNLSLSREYARIFALVTDKLTSNVIFDNVSTRTSLLYAMKALGAIVRVGGQPHLRFTIMKELPTAIGYTDLGVITPSRADPFTSVVYEWKTIGVPFQVSGLDMIKTKDDGIENLLTRMIEAAEAGLREGLGGSTLGLYTNDGETTTTSLTGLQNILSTSTTTGTVGQLSRASQANWRHQSGNVASDFSGNGLSIIRTLYRNCSRHDETPDVLVLTGSAMDNFEAALTNTIQVNLPVSEKGQGDSLMMEAGFWNWRYKGALVFHDDAIPANSGYMLNFKYHKLYVREGRESEVSDLVKSRNYDDLTGWVFFAGNQCNTNLARNGLLQNADGN